MNTMKKSYFGILFFLMISVFLQAGDWRLEADGGIVLPGYNTVQVPNPGGTRFSLRDDLGIDSRAFLRLRLTWRFASRHEVSLLYAPLSLKASGPLPAPVLFDGTAFAKGEKVDALYRFNSYRLTWRWHWLRGKKLDLWVGLTVKIRDAEISVTGANRFAMTDNVGFVPLFHLFMRWRWSDAFGMILEADAAAAKQGRAEDVAAILFWRPSRNTELRAGYRFVEGGANVEQVYNFAFIGYIFSGVAIRF